MRRSIALTHIRGTLPTIKPTTTKDYLLKELTSQVLPMMAFQLLTFMCLVATPIRELDKYSSTLVKCVQLLRENYHESFTFVQSDDAARF